MRRVLIIFACGFSGLLAMGALAWVVLFYSPPGRELLEEIVESQLGGALNSRADIGALKGALPGHLILENVAFEDEAGAWLTAERIEMRWRPFALAGKRIVIDSASILNTRIFRSPPKSDKPADDARQFKVLDNLPRIDVRRLDIVNLDADLNGARQRLDASGALRLDGPEIELALKVASVNGADEADILFAKSPSSGRFTLNALVTAEAGGTIASLFDLRGPTRLRAQADSPINQAVTTINGTVGYYGAFDAVISSDFSKFEGAGVKANFSPGARFDGIEELSSPIALNLRYDAKDRGGALDIAQFTSAIGDITGQINWRAPRSVVQQVNAALKVKLNPAYQPSIQRIAGDDFALDAKLDWRRDDYALVASATGPLAKLTIAKGVTDLRQRISGDMILDAAARDGGDLWLTNGLNLTATLKADLKNEITLNDAQATTSDGSRFAGTGAYGLTDKSLRAKGDVTLTPDFARLFLGNADPAGPITGDIDLSGPLDRFTLKTALETPALRINKSALPPMSIEAALAGLPLLPTGDVTARANNGAPRRLDAQLRSSEDGTIRVPKLSYGGRGFALDGSAQLDPNQQVLNLDMTYKGENGAEPWPGILAAGDLAVKGVLSREGALNQLQATTATLRVNDIAVEGAELTAEGPPGAVRLKLSSNSIITNTTGAISDVSASGQVDARAAPKLSLNAFSALIRDNRAQLTEPAHFDFADGVNVRNLRLTYGAAGVIVLDGGFTPERWQAEMSLTKVNIPDADGQISATLSLDTDEQLPARGEFTLRSLLLLEDEQATINGRAVWNGDVLRLTDREEDASLDMDISLPVKLVKTPKLTVDTGGALSGRAKYQGDVQALAAYMPPVMQSLEGDLSANFTLAGTLAKPDFSGGAEITNGAYTEFESGFSLAGLHAEAQAAYGGASSTLTFKGGARGAKQSGADTLVFSGGVTLGEASNVNFTAKLDQAEFSAHPINQVRASGELTLSGPLDALVAKGDINVAELDAEIVTPESTGLVDIDVIALNDANTEPETLDAPRQSGLDFSVRLHADNRVFIRGRGLDSEWSADVTAEDGREEPLILGAMAIRRGWLDFSGRRFDLTRGAITFDRIDDNNPRLDIRAEHETSDGVTAIISITGRALEPNVELSSTPVLPSEDVMSLILFGKPAQTLSPFESLQTAEALASLSGVGPFGGEGVTGRLRRTVGLDLLNVDIDPENGGGSLTIGKYVSKDVFVSATQDAQGRSGSVRVKYEITDNITVETELEQEGDQTVSANWKKDF
ncbi:translocation/assembly module TamB domain-containing protein [Hyphococcus sp.]|uniref:translocation/assembly module TamB domain-containing protein n=1 Tax=Hyphococcus sp. TaxID=2038636 RepID=UPI0020889F0C|nr:MAG: hypothetical protein DHS20C04_17020 [Marinicaulis sp.]